MGKLQGNQYSAVVALSGRPLSPAITRFAAYALDAGLPALFGFGLVVLVARASLVETFGFFTLALAIAGIQTPLAVLGLGSLFYGRAASRPVASNRLYWPGMAAALSAGAIVYVGTVLVLWAIAPLLLTQMYALAGMRVVGAAGEPLRAIHQARSRPRSYVPWRLLTLLAAVVAVGIVYTSRASVLWYAAIWGLEWLVFAAGLLVAGLRRGVCPPSRRPRMCPVVIKAAPLFVQTVCIAIYMRFDLIYVGWRFGETDLGVYAAAARVAEAGSMVYGVLGLVVAPRIIREWRAGRLSSVARMVLVASGLVSAGAAALCALWGGTLLAATFGPAYAAGGLILAVYVLSTCLTVYGSVGTRLNVAQGAAVPSMVSGVVGAISNVVLTVVLCEFLGAMGAAIATVISYILAVGIIWHFVTVNGR